MITNDDKRNIKILMDEMQIEPQGRVWEFIKKNPDAALNEVYAIMHQIRDEQNKKPQPIVLKENNWLYPVFGVGLIEDTTIEDMDMVARLPYVEKCALMPDGHRVKKGHVPVGGVVITTNCVLPGVVGNDIACSVGLSVTDKQVYGSLWSDHYDDFDSMLRSETYFGTTYNPNDVSQVPGFVEIMERAHNIMGILNHTESQLLLKALIGIAKSHFGTSGDGNHFVEIGHSDMTAVEMFGKTRPVTNNGRRWLAILSHFGSRGLGAKVADFYLDKANVLNPMPRGMEDNAPLFFDRDGWAEDYWILMELCGIFAEKSHKYIHSRLAQKMFMRDIEISKDHWIYNQHNFAWATEHGFIHRKGATPADAGKLGVIPATFSNPSRIVTGLGNSDFLWSASHGAGRKMSRSIALKQDWKNVNEYARDDCGVNLIGAGSDEDPRSYKDIDDVMMFQMNSVKTIGNFIAVHCRMADPRKEAWRKK